MVPLASGSTNRRQVIVDLIDEFLCHKMRDEDRFALPSSLVLETRQAAPKRGFLLRITIY
jgi:hypothetical protein